MHGPDHFANKLANAPAGVLYVLELHKAEQLREDSRDEA